MHTYQCCWMKTDSEIMNCKPWGLRIPPSVVYRVVSVQMTMEISQESVVFIFSPSEQCFDELCIDGIQTSIQFPLKHLDVKMNEEQPRRSLC